MPLKALEHFLILAEDLEATKNFYVDVLGLRVGARPPFRFPGYWLYLGDTPCVHLAGARANSGQEDYLGRRQTAAGTGPIDHMAFVCEGLEAMVAELERRKLPMRHRVVPEQGVHQLFIQDPNGITLELNFFFDARKKQSETAAAAVATAGG
jgi:catechol 2,3-dioxygenase-like lactoylglutathione lyase family enzyme